MWERTGFATYLLAGTLKSSYQIVRCPRLQKGLMRNTYTGPQPLESQGLTPNWGCTCAALELPPRPPCRRTLRCALALLVPTA